MKHMLSCKKDLSKLTEQMESIFKTPDMAPMGTVFVLKMMQPLIFGAQCELEDALGELRVLRRAERDAETVEE